MTKRPLLLAVLLLVLPLAACPHSGPVVKPIANQTHPSADDAVVTPISSTEWSVTMTRQQGASSATVTVRVRTAPTASAPAPHAEVAAAQAWLSLARTAFDAGTFDGAVAAAKQGINTLGNSYRPKLVKDDTTIRIAMADDAIAKGDIKTGATSLMAVLDARITMYFTRYADAIVGVKD